MPRVSVIIPSFNSGPYLERAVQSVLAQTFEDFEIIVVDDGSEHSQPAIVDIDARVRYLAQTNRGVSVARNVGVSAARAELVAFLDHDDEWEPRKLETQLAAVDASPDAAFWCTAFSWVRGDSEMPSDPQAPTYHGLLSNQTVLLSSVLMRATDYLEVGGQNPLLAQTQDWDMLLRLLMDKPPPVMTPECLVRYHLHASNASLDYRRLAFERFSILDDHLRRARSRNEEPGLRAVAAGRARSRELFAYQAIDAARAEQGTARGARMLGHLVFATRMSPRVVARSVRSYVMARVPQGRS